MSDWMYFDNHFLTVPDPEIAHFMARDYQNHWLFREEKRNLVEKRLVELLGASSQEHFFLTSGRYESNFLLLFSHYMDFIRETGRTHILTLENEHPSILQPLQYLEKFEVQGKFLPLNHHGQLEPEALIEAIRPRSSLLSISWANELTAVIQPIAELAEVCEKNDVRFHVDASCVIGKLPFQFTEIPVHFLSFDGQLLHCPAALGALIARKEYPLSPLYFSEEKRPVAEYAALGVALEKVLDKMECMSFEIGHLRNVFETEIIKCIPSAQLFFQESNRLPNCSVVAFKGIHGEALRFLLQRQGMFVSTGGGRLAKILMQCGIDPMLAYGAISFSFSENNSLEEIPRMLPLIESTVKRLQKTGGAIHVAL